MPKLEDVNVTDVPDAIRLGCRTMCRVFNADDPRGSPYFGSKVWPEARLSFSKAYSDAHVPGRHLNALLNAENVLGVELDEACIEQHARAAFFSYSGPVALPLNRKAVDGELTNFYVHNLREGFHALYALAAFRQSEQALETAEKSIVAIKQYWRRDGWRREELEQRGLWFGGGTYIETNARAIGPLVKLYRTTGCAAALDLALLFQERAVDDFFLEDGAYDRDRFGGHTHSTTCTMSSLAQLAEVTRDAALMNRVRAFYDNGLRDITDQLGWCIETSGDKARPDRGEGNNTGDIIETALILGKFGYTEYFGDAERALRGHLLPSQLRDVSFVSDPPNPENSDSRRDMADRQRGAWGFPAPYGHQPIDQPTLDFNMDIVGGVVGSLCEVWRSSVTRDEAGHRVNLLLDRESKTIDVESPYTHDQLRVRVKDAAPLWVRVPARVAADTVVITGNSAASYFSNGYLVLPQPPVGEWVSFAFELPAASITLKHRTREIAVKMRGDEVVAMDSHGADFTFFKGLEDG